MFSAIFRTTRASNAYIARSPSKQSFYLISKPTTIQYRQASSSSSTSSTSSPVYTPATISPSSSRQYQRIHHQQTQQFPPLDVKAYNRLGATAIVWVVSVTILSCMIATFGYSIWWHKEREKAKRNGIDLDKWLEDFEKNDPVVLRMKSMGLYTPQQLNITELKNQDNFRSK